ncbi:hypothetical protein [Paenibacillus sp. BC26]|nr:hypothetical protein [Paenibacillus sp. BC26]SFS62224.1 hypothetical protein SAMN05428962_1617 [Paenibacillus sp. BC26]
MPTNRNSNSKNRGSESEGKDYTSTLKKLDKFASRPSSLNGINKQLP